MDDVGPAPNFRLTDRQLITLSLYVRRAIDRALLLFSSTQLEPEQEGTFQ